MGHPDLIVWQLLLQLALIMLNAVFACAEIAFISISDRKLARQASGGDRRAARLLKLTEQPGQFLSVIQVGITFAGFLGSAFAADNFSGKLTQALVAAGVSIPAHTLNTIAVIAITLILSYFTLVLGELVPKRIAMQNAEKISLAMSGFISFISKLFSPIVWLLTVSTNAILRLLGLDPNAEDEEVTEEEIRLMVDAGSEKGAIDSEERQFIHNLFDFDDKTAEEIMTHRTKLELLWLADTIEKWEKTITESSYSIYPVCGADVDDVRGILNIKDYFRLPEKTKEAVLAGCVKPVYFVPETISTHVLMRNMQKSRHHFAVVVDEYGGVSGIVTINDLLEELVGDLADEPGPLPEQPLVERLDNDTWRIHGAAPLDTVADCLGVKLPDNDYDTFGGLVLAVLGVIPDDGETPELTAYGLNIKVVEVKNRRLLAALVRVIE